PLQLDDRVTRVETRHEKHPGKDDVHLLHFASGRVLQVDGAVAEAAAVGERMEKKRWSRELAHGGRIDSLVFSEDVHGMVWAMPAILLVIATATAFPAANTPSENVGKRERFIANTRCRPAT